MNKYDILPAFSTAHAELLYVRELLENAFINYDYGESFNNYTDLSDCPEIKMYLANVFGVTEGEN